jgi:hypothetical protein
MLATTQHAQKDQPRPAEMLDAAKAAFRDSYDKMARLGDEGRIRLRRLPLRVRAVI